MNTEETLLRSFRAMSADGQDRLVSLARHMQCRFPLRAKPTLSLVQQPKDIQSLDNVCNDRIDFRSIGAAGEAVNGK